LQWGNNKTRGQGKKEKREKMKKKWMKEKGEEKKKNKEKVEKKTLWFKSKLQNLNNKKHYKTQCPITMLNLYEHKWKNAREKN
jgi:hypothetical protein